MVKSLHLLQELSQRDTQVMFLQKYDVKKEKKAQRPPHDFIKQTSSHYHVSLDMWPLNEELQ